MPFSLQANLVLLSSNGLMTHKLQQAYLIINLEGFGRTEGFYSSFSFECSLVKCFKGTFSQRSTAISNIKVSCVDNITFYHILGLVIQVSPDSNFIPAQYSGALFISHHVVVSKWLSNVKIMTLHLVRIDRAL